MLIFSLWMSRHPVLILYLEELLDLLSDLIQDETRSIIFSTHITTDLERIADYIAFVNQGKLVFNETKDDVLERYTIVKGDMELLDGDTRNQFIGIRETAVGFEALADNREEAARLFGSFALLQRPTLEDLIYFTAKGDANMLNLLRKRLHSAKKFTVDDWIISRCV